MLMIFIRIFFIVHAQSQMLILVDFANKHFTKKQQIKLDKMKQTG